MIEKSPNVVWHRATVSRKDREERNGHKALVLWFTGLSASGKSTLAHAVEDRLHKMGCHTFVLDGDNVRHGLCSDLGFSLEDREENLRAHRRGLQADAGDRGDGADRLYLTHAQGTASACAACFRTGIFWRSTATPVSRSVSRVIPRGCTSVRVRGENPGFHRHLLALRGAGQPGIAL